MKVKDKLFRLILSGIAAGMMLALGGCAATKLPVVGNQTTSPTQTPLPVITQTPTPTPTPIAIIIATPTPETTPIPVSLTPIAEAEDHLKTIGTKQTGEDVYKVRLVNSTSKGITEVRMVSMYVYEGQKSASSENLLSEGDVFKDKEERILYYDTSFTATNDAGEKHFHLQLGFEDGSGYTLTDVPFLDINEAVIYYEDEVAYLVYLSSSSGSQVSTKEMELIHRANRAAEEASYHSDEDYDYDEDDDYDDEDYAGQNDHDYEENYDDDEQDHYNDGDYDGDQYDEDRYEEDYYDEDEYYED